MDSDIDIKRTNIRELKNDDFLKFYGRLKNLYRGESETKSYSPADKNKQAKQLANF